MSAHSTHVVIGGEAGSALPAAIGDIGTQARDARGDLLALGPLAHVGETDSRPVPPWLAIAGFGTPADASAWDQKASRVLPGARLLVPALTEPVWWPDELSAERPSWSEQLRPPIERPGLFLTMWINIRGLEPFLGYGNHFRWTVERNGGTWLGLGTPPTVLSDSPGPMATAIIAWPSAQVRRTWYNGYEYLPYRGWRRACSDGTIVSVAALGPLDGTSGSDVQ